MPRPTTFFSVSDLLNGELQESKHSYYRDGVEVLVSKGSIDLEYVSNKSLEVHCLERAKSYGKLINTPLSPMSKTPYSKNYVSTCNWESVGEIKRREYKEEVGFMAKTPRGYSKQDLIVEEMPIDVMEYINGIEDLQEYVNINSKGKASSTKATSGQLYNGILAIFSALYSRHINGVEGDLPISCKWLMDNYGLNSNSCKLIKGTKALKSLLLLDVEYRFNSNTKSAYGVNGNKITRDNKAMSITPTSKLKELFNGVETIKIGLWSKVLKRRREQVISKSTKISKTYTKSKVVSKGALNTPPSSILRESSYSVRVGPSVKVGVEGVQELLEGLDGPIDHLDQACLDGGINSNTTTLACKGDNLIDTSIEENNINGKLSYIYGNLGEDKKLKNLVNKYLRHYRERGSFLNTYKEDLENAQLVLNINLSIREPLRDCIDKSMEQLSRVQEARDIASKRVKNRQ